MAHFLRGLYRGNLGYRWVYNPGGGLGRFEATALLYGSTANPGESLPINEGGGLTDFDGNPSHTLLSVQWGERLPTGDLSGGRPTWQRGRDGRFLFAVEGEVYRTGDIDDETEEVWNFLGVTSDPVQMESLLAPDGYTGALPCNLFLWELENDGTVHYHPNDSPTGSYTVVYRTNGGLGADFTPPVQPGADITIPGVDPALASSFYFPFDSEIEGEYTRADFTETDDQGNTVSTFSVWLSCRSETDKEEPKNEERPTLETDPDLIYGAVVATALLLAVLALAPLVAAVLAEALAGVVSEAALAEAGAELGTAINGPQITAAMAAVRNLFANKIGPVAVMAAAAYGGVQNAQQAVVIAASATASGDITVATQYYEQAAQYVTQVEQQIQRLGR